MLKRVKIQHMNHNALSGTVVSDSWRAFLSALSIIARAMSRSPSSPVRYIGTETARDILRGTAASIGAAAISQEV
jgi:hypothetical protein